MKAIEHLLSFSEQYHGWLDKATNWCFIGSFTVGRVILKDFLISVATAVKVVVGVTMPTVECDGPTMISQNHNGVTVQLVTSQSNW